MKRALFGLFVVACAHRVDVQPTVVIRPYVACTDVPSVVERAACVAHREMDHARRNRDVVKLLCAKSKADQIDALRKTRDEHPDEAHRRVIDDQASALAREAEHCLGELLARTP